MDRLIIDVREPDEYARSHVAGAINIPPADLMEGARALDGVARDATLIVYCKTGSRSNVAAHLLQDMGFVHIVNGINQSHVEAHYL